MASKNSRIKTIRLMEGDLKAIEKIAKDTGKTPNAIMVGAIRKEIETLIQPSEGQRK